MFGSRVDDNRKGEDIDLLITGNWMPNDGFRRKVNFLVPLKTILGDQHIDVVLAENDDQRFIVEEAIRTGIKQLAHVQDICRHIVKQHTGKTVSQHIRTMRLQKACEL